MSTAFPDTRLKDLLQDADFGGRPADELGKANWTWVNSVLQFLEASYLADVAVPRRVVHVQTQVSCEPGMVLCFDPDQPVLSGGYYAAPYATGRPNLYTIGVAMEPGAALATVRVAVNGIVPAAVTGLLPATSSAPVGFDPATAKVRVAQAGDTVIGVQDLQGNLFVFAQTSSAP